MYLPVDYVICTVVRMLSMTKLLIKVCIYFYVAFFFATRIIFPYIINLLFCLCSLKKKFLGAFLLLVLQISNPQREGKKRGRTNVGDKETHLIRGHTKLICKTLKNSMCLGRDFDKDTYFVSYL